MQMVEVKNSNENLQKISLIIHYGNWDYFLAPNDIYIYMMIRGRP